MLNYHPDTPVTPAGRSNFLKYRDRFVGSIAGESLGYFYVKPETGESAPSVIEVDLLDLDSENGHAAEVENGPDIAYLQYTSGSTRTPAGATP